MYEFEWDRAKAASNLKKHEILFSDTYEVFEDPLSVTLSEFRYGENREVTVGRDALGRLLVVVYTWRKNKIRIISARKATPKERRQHEKRI